MSDNATPGAIALYARGYFPMDSPGEPELPWYAPDPRTVFGLDDDSRARTRRRVRRSMARSRDLVLRVDGAFAAVLAACARPRHPDDGVWISARLAALYEELHGDGWAHSFELWDGEELAAGILAVLVGRAAMLESMFHARADAGNALLCRTLDLLAGGGAELCDIQLASAHTLRLGAREISRAEYDERLAAALRG